MSSAPILTRIAITEDEWAAIRKQAIDKTVRPSELLAVIVRKHLAASTRSTRA